MSEETKVQLILEATARDLKPPMGGMNSEVAIAFDVTDVNGRVWENRAVGRGKNVGQALDALANQVNICRSLSHGVGVLLDKAKAPVAKPKGK
jgi:hypothetical protein